MIAQTPTETSEAVASLLSLIAPLPCAVDFRPYFTIHDPSFAALAVLPPGTPPPPMLLGVTNVFFVKALPTWPHVLSVGYKPPPRPPVVVGGSSSAGVPEGSGGMSGRLRAWGRGAIQAARARYKGPQQLLSDYVARLWSGHEPVTKPDLAVLRSLEEVEGEGDNAAEFADVFHSNSVVLRCHFAELTHNFLAPFTPYLRGALPCPGRSPFVSPPQLKPFDTAVFLKVTTAVAASPQTNRFLAGLLLFATKSLPRSPTSGVRGVRLLCGRAGSQELGEQGPGPFLRHRFKPSWLQLYRRFLASPNFVSWFQRRRTAGASVQSRAWQRARVATDITSFLPTMSEVSRMALAVGSRRDLI